MLENESEFIYMQLLKNASIRIHHIYDDSERRMRFQ